MLYGLDGYVIWIRCISYTKDIMIMLLEYVIQLGYDANGVVMLIVRIC